MSVLSFFECFMFLYLNSNLTVQHSNNCTDVTTSVVLVVQFKESFANNNGKMVNFEMKLINCGQRCCGDYC